MSQYSDQCCSFSIPDGFHVHPSPQGGIAHDLRRKRTARTDGSYSLFLLQDYFNVPGGSVLSADASDEVFADVHFVRESHAIRSGDTTSFFHVHYWFKPGRPLSREIIAGNAENRCLLNVSGDCEEAPVNESIMKDLMRSFTFARDFTIPPPAKERSDYLDFAYRVADRFDRKSRRRPRT